MAKKLIRLSADSIDNQLHKCYLAIFNYPFDKQEERRGRVEAYEYISWYVRTGRAPNQWLRRFVNCKADALMRVAARNSESYETMATAVAGYFDRYYSNIG